MTPEEKLATATMVCQRADELVEAFENQGSGKLIDLRIKRLREAVQRYRGAFGSGRGASTISKPRGGEE